MCCLRQLLSSTPDAEQPIEAVRIQLGCHHPLPGPAHGAPPRPAQPSHGTLVHLDGQSGPDGCRGEAGLVVAVRTGQAPTTTATMITMMLARKLDGGDVDAIEAQHTLECSGDAHGLVTRFAGCRNPRILVAFRARGAGYPGGALSSRKDGVDAAQRPHQGQESPLLRPTPGAEVAHLLGPDLVSQPVRHRARRWSRRSSAHGRRAGR